MPEPEDTGQPDPVREPLPPAPPTVREVTNWLTRRPDTLTKDEKLLLKAILDCCPELQAASDQVRAFATMIAELTGQDLPQWMDRWPLARLPPRGKSVMGSSTRMTPVPRCHPAGKGTVHAALPMVISFAQVSGSLQSAPGTSFR